MLTPYPLCGIVQRLVSFFSEGHLIAAVRIVVPFLLCRFQACVAFVVRKSKNIFLKHAFLHHNYVLLTSLVKLSYPTCRTKCITAV